MIFRVFLATALTATLLFAGCNPSATDSTIYLPVWIDTEGGSGADGVVIADIDGDGDLDAVSAWEGSSRVRLHRSLDGGLWLNSTIAEGADVSGVEDVAVADLDGDGDLDVIAACESGAVTWIKHEETWLSFVIDVSADVGCGSWIDVEAGDLNGDGRPEIVAACKGGGWISVLHSPEPPVSGASFERTDIDTTARQKASCVCLVDIDSDSDLDIVSAAREETVDNIVWHENPGPEVSLVEPWSEHAIGRMHDAFWLDVGDIDGDGRLDIAASSWENAEFAWFRQGEDPRDDWTRFHVGQFHSTRGAGITITDLEGDGKIDLVVSTYRDGRVTVFRPITSVTELWWPTTIATPGGRLDLVPVEDLDGDGRLDIVATVDADGGGVVWYRPWP